MSHTIRNNPFHWLRKPRTQPERRAVAAALDDNDNQLPVRAKRNARNLPTEWEDKPVARTSYERRSQLSNHF